MRKVVLCLALSPVVLALLLGSCGPRVRIEPPKEPIRIEMKIEVHIYQHAVEDIGYITGGMPPEEAEPETPIEEETEEKVPPPAKGEQSKGRSFLLRLLGVQVAYAQTASDQQQLKRVLDSMRKRNPTLRKYKADKSVGENYRGYVEERPSPKMSDGKYAKGVRAAIAAENADRRALYQIRARMGRTSPSSVAAAYAKRWREIAKPGEWIQPIVNKKPTWKQK